MKNYLAVAILAAFAAAASPVHAAIIDFSAPIAVDVSAIEKLQAGEKPAPETMQTLGKIARFALMANYQDEAQTLQPGTKQARFELTLRLFNDPKVDLSIDDIKMVRDIIAKAYGSLVVGQVMRVMDGKTIVDTVK